MRARLAELYGGEFARWLPVDVVGYAGVDGGSTVLNPHQFLVSSASSASRATRRSRCYFAKPRTRCSRSGARARSGRPCNRRRARGQADARRAPALLLFFTTGQAVRARLGGARCAGLRAVCVSRGRVGRSSRVVSRGCSSERGSRTWTAVCRWPRPWGGSWKRCRPRRARASRRWCAANAIVRHNGASCWARGARSHANSRSWPICNLPGGHCGAMDSAEADLPESSC